MNGELRGSWQQLPREQNQRKTARLTNKIESDERGNRRKKRGKSVRSVTNGTWHGMEHKGSQFYEEDKFGEDRRRERTSERCNEDGKC